MRNHALLLMICSLLYLAGCAHETGTKPTTDQPPSPPVTMPFSKSFVYHDPELVIRFTNTAGSSTTTTSGSSKIVDANIYDENGNFITRRSALGYQFLTVLTTTTLAAGETQVHVMALEAHAADLLGEGSYIMVPYWVGDERDLIIAEPGALRFTVPTQVPKADAPPRGIQ